MEGLDLYLESDDGARRLEEEEEEEEGDEDCWNEREVRGKSEESEAGGDVLGLYLD